MINCSIVTYNNEPAMLQRVVLCALKNDSLNKLFLIDNSPDEAISSDILSLDKVHYIKTDKNIGFGAGHNLALKESISENADYHAVLNPDIYFSDRILDKIHDYLNQNMDVGLLMPKVLHPNGDIQYLCKLLPTPLDWIFRRFLPFKRILDNRNNRFELRFLNYDKVINVPYLSGCFMTFRIEVLKEVGLFDENIFMYGEDTDITRRIHIKYKTVFYPEVSIFHEHQKGSHKSIRLLWIHIKSARYYFCKWGWFLDSERKEINEKALQELEYKR